MQAAQDYDTSLITKKQFEKETHETVVPRRATLRRMWVARVFETAGGVYYANILQYLFDILCIQSSSSEIVQQMHA